MPSYDKAPPDLKDPRFKAAIDMMRRTGMREFQIRYDQEQEPIVWVAVASYSAVNGIPRSTGKINHHKVGADLHPLTAIFRLCEDAIDGGICKHCHRPTGFDQDFGAMPLEEHVCWYQWDPENETFRRGCEGDA